MRLKRIPAVLPLLLALALATTGCLSIQVEAGFKQPSELTATAVAQAVPTATPKAKLGKLAFIQGGDIWVKDLPDGETERLTRDGHNSTPHWSPSGEWLSFQKDDQTAWIMRATGADAHQVGPDLKVQVSWSPSADQFVYNSLGGIYLVSADGSEKRELVPPPGKEPGVATASSFAWSPDGQWIAFETTALQQPPTPPQKIVAQNIYRIKVDGISLTEVYRNPDPSKPFRLVDWSPDGQYLLAWQDDFFPSNSGAADGWPLFALPVAGGPPAKVSERVLRSRDFLSWAPAGHGLALIDGGYRSTWYRKHLAVSDLSGLAQLRSEPSRADLFPAWSPDGRYIAYTSAPEVQTDGGNDAKEAAAQRKIWVVQPDGSGRRQLTSDPSYRDERPQWSRDGAFILFGRFYQNEQMQVWLMRADGSELRQVVDELTPTPGPASAWFGYYGTVGWRGLYDWWQGPPAPGQTPTVTASPNAGPSPATTPAAPGQGPKSGPTVAAGDLSAFLQAAVAYLEAMETIAQPEAVVSVALQNLARSKGISPTYVKRSEGDPDAWIGASPGGAFLLWRQGDKVFYQTWGRGEGDLFSFFASPVIAFRRVERNGSLEMGLIPANFGSTADSWFFLLRLMDGRWQQVWSPLPAAKDSWASGGGKVEFLGQGIDAFRLTGPVPRDVSASRVFDEFGVFLKQQYESEWRRQGDVYVRVTGHIVPTPMTALANFIDGLQRGDKAASSRFAVNPQTAEHAVGMKLDMPAGGSGWAGRLQTQEGEEVHISFFDTERRQRSFTASLAQQVGEWRVKAIEQVPEGERGMKAIEQVPEAPDPGAATTPQPGGSR